MRRLVFQLLVLACTAASPGLASADDQQIAKDIMQQLQVHKEQGQLRGFNIDLQVDKGTVWLKGHVSQPDQRKLVLDVARNVSGVQQVINELDLKDAKPVADAAKTAAKPLAAKPAPAKAETAKTPAGTSDATPQGLGSMIRQWQPKPLESKPRTPAPANLAQTGAPQTSAAEKAAVKAVSHEEPIGAASSSRRSTRSGTALGGSTQKLAVNVAPADYAEPATEKPSAPANAVEVVAVTPVRPAAAKPEAPSHFDDAELLEQISRGVAQEKKAGKLKSFSLDLDVSNGNVVLNGRVSSRDELLTILDVANGVPGVKQVVNHLAIGPANPAAPVSHTESAGAKQNVAPTSPKPVTTTLAKPSASAKPEEKAVAKPVEMVAVTPVAPAVAKPESPRLVDDAELLERISQAVAEEKKAGKLKSFALDLDVTNGKVVMNGHVSTREELLTVLGLAHRVQGVKQVVNNLTVGPANPAAPVGNAKADIPAKHAEAAKTAATKPDPTSADVQSAEAPSSETPVSAAATAPANEDKQIAQEIVQHLQEQKAAGKLKGFGIDLNVVNGDVWLKGHVASKEQQDLALDIARNVRGVKQVVNDLTIKQATPAPAAQAAEPSAKQPTATGTLAGLGGALKNAFRGVREGETKAANDVAKTAQGVKVPEANSAPRSSPLPLVVPATHQAAEPTTTAVPVAAPAEKSPFATVSQPLPLPASSSEPTGTAVAHETVTPAPAARYGTSPLIHRSLPPVPNPFAEATLPAEPLAQPAIQYPLAVATPFKTPTPVAPLAEAIRPASTEIDDSKLLEQISRGVEREKQAGKLRAFTLDLDVIDGKAVLSGRVLNDDDLHTILGVAHRVKGIKQVVNNMAIGPVKTAQGGDGLDTPREFETAKAEANPAAAVQPIATVQPAPTAQPFTVQTAAVQPIAAQPAVGSAVTTPAVATAPPGAVPQPMPAPFAAGQVQMVPYPVPYMMPYGQMPAHFSPVPMARPMIANQTPMAFAQSFSMPAGNVMPVSNVMAAQMQMQMPAQLPGGGVGMAPARYDQPNLPAYSWPSYASHPNYAAVTYPKQYSPTAWPYIGPFYPYPQVPLGWRKVSLEWDDGWWQLDFWNK